MTSPNVQIDSRSVLMAQMLGMRIPKLALSETYSFPNGFADDTTGTVLPDTMNPESIRINSHTPATQSPSGVILPSPTITGPEMSAAALYTMSYLSEQVQQPMHAISAIDGHSVLASGGPPPFVRDGG